MSTIVARLYWPGDGSRFGGCCRERSAVREAHQERHRRREVDGPDAGHGTLLADPRPGRDERAVHVHVVREVDQVREIAVLAEELRERDPLPKGRRVELVRRPQHDDHVARAARMECIRPVDVPELLLLHDLEHDLLARVGRVGQVLERRDDLAADGLVVPRRDDAARIPAGDVDVDLGGSAGPARLRLVHGSGARAARQLLICSGLWIPASVSTLPALTANHWGAKPWSEETNVVGLSPIRSRASFRVSSASS